MITLSSIKNKKEIINNINKKIDEYNYILVEYENEFAEECKDYKHINHHIIKIRGKSWIDGFIVWTTTPRHIEYAEMIRTKQNEIKQILDDTGIYYDIRHEDFVFTNKKNRLLI